MNDDLPLGEFGAGALHKLKKMLLMSVDTLVLKETEEMELGIVLLPVFNELAPLLVLKEMLLMGVDALVLEKPEEMELGIVLLPVSDKILPLLVLEEIPRSKTVINALQFLNYDTPSPHIKVAYFRRALITVGKTDRLAAAIEQTVRIARANLIYDRSLRSIN
jgi:hypothetical protein